jgi:hypothetical protein
MDVWELFANRWLVRNNRVAQARISTDLRELYARLCADDITRKSDIRAE